MHAHFHLSALIGALIIGFSTTTVKGNFVLISNGGTEVKIKDSRCAYLSELGLTSNDLSWGKAVRGVKIAALLLPKVSPPGLELRTLAVSFCNRGRSPLIIPLLDNHPQISLYTSGGSPRKLLLGFQPMINSGDIDVIRLEPGKMITFKELYQMNNFNKDHVPMIISVAFSDYGFAGTIPMSEQGLVLASNEVRFP